MDDKLQAQLQIRQKAEELHDYMKDLLGWQKDIKQKEKGLKRGADAPLPPVRGRAQPATAAASPAATVKPPPAAAAAARPAAAAQPRQPAGHTYDHYRDKWEKFDVDAALASDDEAEAPSSVSAPRNATTGPQPPANPTPSGGESGASRPLPAARLKAAAQAAAARQSQPATAEGLKDQGNAHFKSGAFSQAVDSYTASLALEPTCLAFANRAMAQLKLGKYAAAEWDCTEALSLDPTYVKAYQRRATARRELGDLLGAIDDFESALRLEPTNKATAADRQACISKLMDGEGLVWPAGDGSGSRERVPVRLAAPAVAADGGAAAAAGASAAGELAEGADEEVLIQAVSSSKVEPSITARKVARVVPVAAGAGPAAVAAPSAAVSAAQDAGGSSGARSTAAALASGEAEERLPPLAQQQPRSEAEVIKSPAAVAAGPSPAVPSSGGPSFTPAAVAAAAAAPPTPSPAAAQPAGPTQAAPASPAALPVQEMASPSAAPAAAAQAAEGASCSGAVTAAMAGALRRVGTSAPMKAPRTGLEFEKGWKALKGDPEQQAAYLQLIPPAKLPTILKQALTPSLLCSLLRTLLGPALAGSPGQALGLLGALPAVPRFDMNLLSLGTADKAALREAWDAAAAAAEAGAGEGQDGGAELAERLAAARQRYKL